MRLIFYGVVNNGTGERLRRIIEGLVPANNIEIYQSIESLSHGLRLPTGEPTVAVLLAASQKDLQDILTVGDLISDFRTILIIPDNKKETISRGHRLLPRYLGFVGDDLSDVAAVLGKTLQLVQMESKE